MTTLYCPKCGYNLSNLTENRCPECGEGFHPASLQKLQNSGVSSRSVVLQLIFVPIAFAVMAPMCIIGAVSAGESVPLLVLMMGLLLGVIVMYTAFLSQAYVRSRRLRDGEDRVPWLFRKVWPCCVLFTLVEACLTVGYFAGGCAVILMNLNFH